MAAPKLDLGKLTLGYYIIGLFASYCFDRHWNLAVEGFELRPVGFVTQIFMGAPMMAYSITLLDDVDGAFFEKLFTLYRKNDIISVSNVKRR